MSIIYAMSDIHGCLLQFEEALSLIDLSGDNKLVLLGDYIHGGPDSYGVLEKIMELEQTYGNDKVIVLVGNHEDMAMNGRWPISEDRFADDDKDYEVDDDKYLYWMQTLRRYYTTENQIFCHAGVDEDAGDMWEWGTDDYTFTEKYPAETGKFCMDIIAGHVGTSKISGDPYFHDIYFDGESHYYIDGTVLDSGKIPVIKVDTVRNKYYRVAETGDWIILPYDEEN
ncbi:metallophosphoesterase [Variimorphobacter saccharofermentans]|nr:metallophosphoesterase [Variimorphobacter saccharofermentans]